jgi:hypothetical protein
MKVKLILSPINQYLKEDLDLELQSNSNKMLYNKKSNQPNKKKGTLESNQRGEHTKFKPKGN